MRKPGCTEPVYYFINSVGHHILSPHTGAQPPSGYRTEAMDTLPDIRRLQDILRSQEMREAEKEIADEMERRKVIDQRVHDRLYARMTSGDCSAYEREFWEHHLKLRDEKKAKKYEDIYLQHQLYLWALENDTPKGRTPDQETVNLDRIDL